MTALALPDPDTDRLNKLTGLLASEFDGERANAARMATRLLRQHNLTWADLVHAATRQPEHAGASTRAHVRTWQEDRLFCLRRSDVLSAWEQGFLTNLGAQRGISEKQRTVLAGIVARVMESRS